MSDQKRLSGMTVAVLVANGFEEIVMTDTQKALAAEGAAIRIISHEIGLANGWHEGTWGHNFYIDTRITDALPSDFDGLLVPGGERSIAALRENAHARRVVKGMMEAGKLVAIVGDAVEMLVAAEAARGRKVTGRRGVARPRRGDGRRLVRGAAHRGRQSGHRREFGRTGGPDPRRGRQPRRRAGRRAPAGRLTPDFPGKPPAAGVQNTPASRPAASVMPSSSQSAANASRHSPRQSTGSATARQRRPVVIVSMARRVPVPSWPARI